MTSPTPPGDGATRQSHMVRSGDAAIETYVQGSGPSVVMLPSYGRDGGEDFDLTAARIAASGYLVVRPQPRGAAGSSGPLEGVTMKDLCHDVVTAVGEFTSGPSVILGQAFGNIVARGIALYFPDAVAALGLIAASSSTPPHDIGVTPFQAGDLDAPESERLDALRRGFFAPGHDPRVWLSGWYPATLAMEKSCAPAGNLSDSDLWSAGSSPILEVIPEFDPFKPREQWTELRDQLGARVTTRIVAGASHALFPEEPDGLIEAILPWLHHTAPIH